MANISISDLYRGEGPGEKYGGILNAAFHEIPLKPCEDICRWVDESFEATKTKTKNKRTPLPKAEP